MIRSDLMAPLRCGAVRTGSRRLTALAVVSGYVALTLWMYRPAVAATASKYFADSGDGAAFLWNYYAVPPSLPSLRTELIFHPVGADLAFHTGTPLIALAISVARWVLPDPAATNLVLLASVVASGVVTYLLARHEKAPGPLAFFAGVAFVLLPWRYGRLYAHHNLVHSFVVPLGLLALLRLIDQPSKRRGVAYGVAVAVGLWIDFTYFLFLLMASAVVMVWRHRSIRSRRFLTSAAVAGVVTAVVAAPILAGTVRALVSGELDPLRGWGGADVSSLDLLSYVTPPPWHLLGDHFEGVNTAIVGGERLGYVGIGVLLGGLVGAATIIATRRGGGAFVVMAAVFTVLSFGPFLHVNGEAGARFEMYGTPFSVPMPYLLLHYVPVLNGLRVPARFSAVAALGVAVVAAVGLGRLVESRGRLAVSLVAAALVALTVVDLRQDWDFAPLLDPDIPPAYEALAAADGDRAVIEVPLQWRDGFGVYGGAGADQSILLYYATAHGKPLASGMVARLSAERLDALRDVDVYRALLQVQGDPIAHGTAIDPRADAVFDVHALSEAGIGWVIYHRDRPVPAVLARLEAADLEVLSDDGTTVIYEVPEG